MARHGDEHILVASIILLCATLSPSFAAARFRDTLNISFPLYDGETLVSAGGTFALGFFSPNISSDKRYLAVWYYGIPTHDNVWVANRRNPVHGFTGSLTLSPNGTLLVVDRHNSSAIIWSSQSTRNTIAAVTNPVAQLLDTGNLVVRDSATGGKYIWQSFDYPSNTLLPGMFIGQDLRTGLSHNLTSWTSDTDPSPGKYTFEILIRGVPQLAVTQGPDHSVHWRAGPWMGDGFTGNADLPAYKHVVNITFLTNSERVGYYYESVDDSVSRVTAYPNGMAGRVVWLDPPGKWSDLTRWVQCDVMSLCGPFGICNDSEYPFICLCLWGFRPKNPDRWKLRDGTHGCVRNTTLDCSRNGTSTDGFVAVTGVKLPDTSVAVADRRIGLDECRARCLKNCSCTGYSLADVTSGGSGCIMWKGELTDMLYSNGGQELHVRLAAADVVKSTVSGHSDHKGRTIASIVGSIAGILIVGSVLIGYLLIHHGKRKNRARTLNGGEMASGSDIDLPLFAFETIAEATNNFSYENKLGEGGFGPVYKGNIDGKEIAVKRLSKSSTQGLDEFKNEVMLIAKLQHRNLVLLLGCCIQRQERMLIYEYMPNRSLDSFLFDKRKNGLLNWQLRYRIILGIARGVLYLHQDSVLRIIHRDLKASNILLNEKMVPKVSDFGLARIFGEEEANSMTKRVVGTYGTGLELMERRHALQLVDESIDNSFSISEVLKCIKVGLLCVQEYPEDRPLMSSVILMLTSDKEVIPEPKRPGFVARRPSFEVDRSSSTKQEPLSMNELTLTMPHGR